MNNLNLLHLRPAKWYTFQLKSWYIIQPLNTPDVDKLEKYLKKNYHGANYHVAYEAGFCGFWIQRSVNQIGIRCDVIHTTDVPTNAKESKRKTDKVDSLKKAKGLKNGELNAIYVPN